MSQKATRKAPGVGEDKDKRQTDSPVKEMKKKMAANAEKEKQAAEKNAEKTEKQVEKNDKPAEKTDKTEKTDKVDKKSDKVEKKSDKVEKKPEPASEKKEESKDDKAAKPEKQEQKKEKPKQNGTSVNGTNGEGNGTVSGGDDSDEWMEQDEMFPELAYDSSDAEYEPSGDARSLTRRSQVKATRTPETPRPASDKQTDKDTDDSKILKLKEDVPSTDRKLRSADSPKPQEKKQDTAQKAPETQEKPQESKKSQEPQEKTQESPKKAQESPKKAQESKKVPESPNTQQEKAQESPKKPAKEAKENEPKGQEEKENGEKVETEVVIEIDGDEEPRKTDTNFSKSRVKVSPYRRSMRLADQTTTSVMANYTGNNTTMEMDITESSSFASDGASLDDSSYLSGLRSIRGRRSYKPLKEMTTRHITHLRPANVATASELPKPTGTVVGRKRKPDPEDSIELAADAADTLNIHGKRMRILDRLASSFRRTASSTPLPARRAAEIVGINTDLPLTAPVAAAETFDPETLKPSPPPPTTAPVTPPTTPADKDNKRCILM